MNIKITIQLTSISNLEAFLIDLWRSLFLSFIGRSPVTPPLTPIPSLRAYLIKSHTHLSLSYSLSILIDNSLRGYIQEPSPNHPYSLPTVKLPWKVTYTNSKCDDSTTLFHQPEYCSQVLKYIYAFKPYAEHTDFSVKSAKYRIYFTQEHQFLELNKYKTVQLLAFKPKRIICWAPKTINIKITKTKTTNLPIHFLKTLHFKQEQPFLMQLL